MRCDNSTLERKLFLLELKKKKNVYFSITSYIYIYIIYIYSKERGGTVVKVLCYKSEGRWFDSSWCHWNFSLT